MSNNSGFKKYFSNTSWLFVQKMFFILIGLFFTFWFARYLGPEQYGIYNYVVSFVGLFGVFSNLGLDKLISKELLTHPHENQQTMGTSFVLRLIGALIILPLIAWSVSMARPGNELIFFMVIIVSSAFFFKSMGVIRYCFESRVQAKYNVIIESIVTVISLSIKGLLILLQAPLIAFAWVILAESILLSIGYIYIYLSKSNKLSTWQVSIEKVKYLLKEAWPLILASAAYMIFIRIDQIMLGSMIGDTSVGIYAAAVKISEGWMFIPGIIAASLFPAMINAKKRDYSLYLRRTQHLLNLMAFLGVFVGIGVTILASPFINLVFGENYQESAVVLIIHIWAMVFNAISIISFRYFLVEGLQKYSFYRAFAGVILNIVLNYFLIPAYGVIGAAIATVISQAVAAYLLNAISLKTRPMFLMQTKALLLYGTLDTFIHIKSLRANK